MENKITEDYICFEVFVRGQNTLEYKHSSRLHALDAHHALMLARDCYTRRSEARGLWVIKSEDLHEAPKENGLVKNRLFEFFGQLKSGLEYRHIASIWADTESIAFEKAEKILGKLVETLPIGGIWICESSQISALQLKDKNHFFDPMTDKDYRFPTFYKLPDSINHM